MQTYGKIANLPNIEHKMNFLVRSGLIVLLQHGVLGKGYQLGGLGKLCAFFGASFSHKEPGGRAHIINGAYQSEENCKDGKNEQCTVERPPEKDEGNHHQIDSYKEKSNGLMRKTLVQQQVMDMVPVRAERAAAVEYPDTKDPERVQQRHHQDRKSYSRRSGNAETYIIRTRDIDEFDNKYRIDGPDQQRAGVTHEYLGRLEIEDEEGHQASCQRERYDSIRQHVHVQEINAEYNSG